MSEDAGMDYDIEKSEFAFFKIGDTTSFNPSRAIALGRSFNPLQKGAIEKLCLTDDRRSCKKQILN